MKLFIEVLGIIAYFILLSAMSALPVMWLWNWIMPDLLEVVKISFVQAWGLSLLTGLLFRVSATKD